MFVFVFVFFPNGKSGADLILEQINPSEKLAPVISSKVGEADRQANSLVGASVLR